VWIRGVVVAAAVLCWPLPPDWLAPALDAADPPAPRYEPDPLPPTLGAELTKRGFRRDPKSGNYLAPKVASRTPDEPLVPVLIDGKYVKDLRGRTVFLRQSIRDKLLAADAALFAKTREHLVINYGFRSNALQHELYQKLHGKGAVAPAGASFHETGMALDINNWRSAQRYLIEAGFVGGCYGIEEDLVHYSVGELTKASNMEAFNRCTLKEIPDHILKSAKQVGDTDTLKKVGTAGVDGLKKIRGLFGGSAKEDEDP
jgi:hypothetical protein